MIASCLTLACAGADTAPSQSEKATILNALAGPWSPAPGASTGSCERLTVVVTRGTPEPTVDFYVSCPTHGASILGVTAAYGPNQLRWASSDPLVACFGPEGKAVGPTTGLSASLTAGGFRAATLVYSGTVCGVPISGSVVMRNGP